MLQLSKCSDFGSPYRLKYKWLPKLCWTMLAAIFLCTLFFVPWGRLDPNNSTLMKQNRDPSSLTDWLILAMGFSNYKQSLCSVSLLSKKWGRSKRENGHVNTSGQDMCLAPWCLQKGRTAWPFRYTTYLNLGKVVPIWNISDIFLVDGGWNDCVMSQLMHCIAFIGCMFP